MTRMWFILAILVRAAAPCGKEVLSDVGWSFTEFYSVKELCFASIVAAASVPFGIHCFTLASNLASSADGGSDRPPRYLARNSSDAALKAMLLTGRANPWPSSGKT